MQKKNEQTKNLGFTIAIHAKQVPLFVRLALFPTLSPAMLGSFSVVKKGVLSCWLLCPSIFYKEHKSPYMCYVQAWDLIIIQ